MPNDRNFQERFYKALKNGAIPIVASLLEPLPFEDLIDWRNAVLRLPTNRLNDLPKVLERISVIEMLEMKRKERFYLENYLGNIKGMYGIWKDGSKNGGP